jgi:transcriptional regulator with GAF, ATPase, and Fis domain
MEVNGRRKLTARLGDGDRIRLGGSELVFTARDPPPSAPTARARVEAMESLVRFSGRLLAAESVGRLLDELVDAVLGLTRAEKGFVILVEDGGMEVKAARNLARETIEDAVSRVSDSIVQRVVSTRRAVIVADAHDVQWSSSSSVVNLKLCSVMCAPLMRKGEPFGVLYLGNDSVVNLFDDADLEVLTVFAAQASLLVENALLLDSLRSENEALRRAVQENKFGEIIGAGAGMREVYRRIEKVAATDVSVLVTGETGTGKDLVARELHRRSPRAKGPFVAVDCGAIPASLLESELFGHTRGAFTGAIATRPGKFQEASGGTLFLDEIGEMPLPLQVKLLRALQERTVTKVGDTRPEALDIRVVAATNKVLPEEISAGRFREDLFYRLNVVTIALPPLRDRGDDVLVIARYFLQKHAREFGSAASAFTPAATAALHSYRWPGNIRELENRVKKAVVLADAPQLGRGSRSRAGQPRARRAPRGGEGGVPAAVHRRGPGAEWRQPHQDREGPGRRSAHRLPPSGEAGGRAAGRRATAPGRGGGLVKREALAALAAAAVALAACPLPQPVASVRRENGGATTTPPRVDTSSVVPGETLVRVSTACPDPPTFHVRANVIDDDTTELVSVRWFVDYAPDALGSRPMFSEEVPGSEDGREPQGPTPPPLTLGAPFDTAAGTAHVLELVVSNGFYALYTDGLPLPNRTPQPGFETQVFRWVFQFDPASDRWIGRRVGPRRLARVSDRRPPPSGVRAPSSGEPPTCARRVAAGRLSGGVTSGGELSPGGGVHPRSASSRRQRSARSRTFRSHSRDQAFQAPRGSAPSNSVPSAHARWFCSR